MLDLYHAIDAWLAEQDSSFWDSKCDAFLGVGVVLVIVGVDKTRFWSDSGDSLDQTWFSTA